MLIEQNKELASQTTLKVGGSAEYFACVANESELVEAIAFAKKHELPITVLGCGSNVLIADDGVAGLVIRMSMKGMHTKLRDNAVLLTAGAGEVLDEVVAHTVQEGLWGIENLSHIPGTVGATPVQNVGAYGVEVKDVIDSVRVFNRETEAFEVLQNSDCVFGYRDSIFKTQQGKKYILVSVTFLLSHTAKPILTYKDLQLYFENAEPTLQEIRNAVIAIRSKKFPNWHEVGTAGSFFKNPTVSNEVYQTLLASYPKLPGFAVDGQQVKLSLGWILDKVLQLKGHSAGPVATYAEQALVLVTEKGATAKDIEIFANEIIEKVKNKIGIEIEFEVTKIK